MQERLERWEKALQVALKRAHERGLEQDWQDVQRIANVLEAMERERGIAHVRTKRFKETFVEELKTLHRLDPDVAIALARKIEERVPRFKGLAQDVALWPRLEKPGHVVRAKVRVGK